MIVLRRRDSWQLWQCHTCCCSCVPSWCSRCYPTTCPSWSEREREGEEELSEREKFLWMVRKSWGELRNREVGSNKMTERFKNVLKDFRTCSSRASMPGCCRLHNQWPGLHGWACSDCSCRPCTLPLSRTGTHSSRHQWQHWTTVRETTLNYGTRHSYVYTTAVALSSISSARGIHMEVEIP